MTIVIKTIPHSRQRYETCGDYWIDKKGILQVRVSKLSDWRRVSLIIIHELWEFFIVKHKRISLKSIDRFDSEYEVKRPIGDVSEPGDDPKSPYRNPHCSASGVERLLASELNVCWKSYENEITRLP